MKRSDDGDGRPRALYILQAAYPWEVRAEKICQALAHRGWDVHLGAAGGDGLPDTERLPDGTVVHRVHRQGRRPLPTPLSLAWQQFCDELGAKLRPDLIIVRDLPLARQALRTGRRIGVPVVFDMAENYPALNAFVQGSYKRSLLGTVLRNQQLGHLYEAWTVRRAAITLTVVEESSERLLGLGADPRRLLVISNTPRLSSITWPREPAPPAPNGEMRLLYVGQIEPLRGLDTAIRALGLLVARGVMAHFTIVGDDRVFGPSLREVARVAGVAERVTFPGRVPNEKIYRFIEQADIGLIPHVRNAFTDSTVPNKLFDYMLGGLPVVVSNARPMERIVLEEQCGAVFPTGDAEGLAAAVTSLAAPEVRQAASVRARAAAERRYHWERDADVLIEAVTRVTA
jgi:glycosyltransferase involved in cell wall biosynthesis